MNKWLKLIVSIVICEFAGIIGSIFTTPAIGTWYAGLTKPSFNPPNWLFAPVWTLLFLLMGISLFLVWNSKSKSKKIAIYIFFGQLVLNILWSILFFGMKSPILGVFEIILLWIAILLTIISFVKISKPAGYLLIPYIIWVSFAAALNFALMVLN